MVQQLRRAIRLAVVVVVFVAAPASALEVDVNGGALTLLADPADGEQSRLTVSATDAGYTVTETGAAGGTLVAGPNAACTVPDGLTATCSHAGAKSLIANLGGGADHLAVSGAIPGKLHGSDGNDDITGGSAADILLGDDGDDILRARDGVADATIDCGSGTGDAAFVDPSGDPAPANCEAVDTGAAAPAPTPAGGQPGNTFPPAVRGRLTAGERLVCDPGTWTAGSSFAYAWTLIAPDGTRTPAASTIDFITPAGAGGSSAECLVTATNDKGQTALAAPAARLAAPVPARTYPAVELTMTNFTAPTSACKRRERYCEVEEVRRRVLKPGLHLRFKGVELRGLRSVPAGMRSDIRPGTVVATKPKPGAKLVSSDEKPVTVTVSYYVPDPARNCPVEENVNVRGGADHTLAELVKGLSLRNAVRALRENGCTAADYVVDYRYGKGAVDAEVTGAKATTGKGRDQLRLTVLHSAPDLQLGVQALAPRRGRLPLRLSTGATNEVHLVASKKQATDFAVSVATRVGTGFKNAKVELRSPSGLLVDSATTGDDGVARFTRSDIADDGTYELWASVTDVGGDALVGWKPIRARAVKADFAGFDGRDYDHAKGLFTARSARRGVARASAAGGAPEEMRTQALRTCEDMGPVIGRMAASYFAPGPDGGFTVPEVTSVIEATTLVCAYGGGKLTLAQTIEAGLTPTLATLGGNLTLAVDPVALTTGSAIAFRGNQLIEQTRAAIAVGRGALAWVSRLGVTLQPGGQFSLQSGGGTAFGPAGAKGRITVDATAPGFAIEPVGGYTLIGFAPGQGGNVLSDNGLGIISNDGASLVSGGAGNVLSDNGLGIISNDGASIISGGAGNIISNDGAS